MSDSVQQITALVHRYCELIDTGDFDGFAAQFANGTWFKADAGEDGVRRWLAENVQTYDGLPCTKHVTTNLVIDVDEDGDTAHASSYVMVLQALPDFPLQIIFAGRYRDRFARVDGIWEWRERRVISDLYGDPSHHTRTRPQRADPARLALDRTEIADVAVRYARALDAHDWRALAACFTPDAVYHYPGGSMQGVDAIVDRCRRALDPLTASQHLVGSHIADVDGDVASASTYFQAQHVRHGTDGGDTFIIAGNYDDRLVRTVGGWRIVERTQSYTWTDGNPAVVARAG